MRYSRVRFPYRLSSVLLAATTALVVGCQEQRPDHEAPAHVDNPPVESELSRLTLTERAVERLGVETAKIEARVLGSTRTYGAELIAPPGRALTSVAPLAGMVVGDPPQPGVVVQAGRELFRLLPLSPDEDPLRREAEARARLEAARAGARRAARLLEDQAGSQRRHEEAQAELAAAEATHRSLSAQLEGLRQSGLEPESAGVYAVSSPISGRLVAVHVANNQTVAASAPLFEVSGDDPLWVRVPVYAGDLSALQAEAPATLRTLGAAPDDVVVVEPVKALPRADPDAVTVDLFYRLPNPGRRFHPGQKVSAVIGLAGAGEEAVVISHGAILHDAHGGTWVYENPSPNVYVRRRVEVERVADGLAVLARGPGVGTRVVVTGAPELFGAEFGVGH